MKKMFYDTGTRVIDGGEPMEFRCLFRNWREKDQTTAFTKNRRISGKKREEFMARKFLPKIYDSKIWGIFVIKLNKQFLLL